MSEKKRILIQLDSDPLPSVFDRIVAVNAGAEEVLSYGGVTPESVRDLVYGAIFTRGAQDLHRTAIFIGGQDVRVGEELLERARASFLGKLRVSVLLDSSGANTTSAAAVAAVSRAVSLEGCPVLVLGGTGSVGRRVARLLAGLGAQVRLGSRRLERARAACDEVVQRIDGAASVEPVTTESDEALDRALEGARAVVSAGGLGAVLLPKAARTRAVDLSVAVDLNAVPPLGIEGVDVMDHAVERDGVLCYGAIGVGGAKMKIHKAAIAALFERNDQTLDAETVFEIAQRLEGGSQIPG